MCVHVESIDVCVRYVCVEGIYVCMCEEGMDVVYVCEFSLTGRMFCMFSVGSAKFARNARFL